jgi:hypothetical protein
MTHDSCYIHVLTYEYTANGMQDWAAQQADAPHKLLYFPVNWRKFLHEEAGDTCYKRI